MNKILLENIIKNGILLTTCLICYPLIRNTLLQIPTASVTDLLTTITIMLVFGAAVNFAFSYEKVNIKNTWQRFVGHVTTFVAMMILLLVIESIIILVQISIPFAYPLVTVIGLLSIICILLYDFWDLFRYKGFKS